MSTDFDRDEFERLRRGDIGALEACYRAHGARVHRLCRSLLGRLDDADDATQEVFLKVYERARQFSGQAGFSTWLYQVTVNHCLHRLERERRRAAEPLPDDAEGAAGRWTGGTDADLRAVDDRDAVERLLASLQPEQRAIVLLREVEGLDYREIAAVLGVPVGTVMSRLHRARQRLIELAAASSSRNGTP